jgi:hypothetical protein
MAFAFFGLWPQNGTKTLNIGNGIGIFIGFWFHDGTKTLKIGNGIGVIIGLGPKTAPTL